MREWQDPNFFVQIQYTKQKKIKWNKKHSYFGLRVSETLHSIYAWFGTTLLSPSLLDTHGVRHPIVL